MLHQARRLGLAQGRTLIVDDMEEMSYVFDLAIYTAPTESPFPCFTQAGCIPNLFCSKSTPSPGGRVADWLKSAVH